MSLGQKGISDNGIDKNSRMAVQRYMNRRAQQNEAYVPTLFEHLANIISHGVAIVPSCVGLKELLILADSSKETQVAFTYGMAITCLFTMSTLYHVIFLLGKYETLKFYLHLFDRATIYLFIAASYTPWLTLRETGVVGGQLRWIIWFLALVGILYQVIFHEKYKFVETCLYMSIGASPGIALVFTTFDRSGLSMMAAGGIVYVVGVVFFKADGVIPCAHAIWHIHVVIGAAFQYYAVKLYLLPKYSDANESDIVGNSFYSQHNEL